MKLVENIMRFEKHLKNAKKLINKDISDYFVYNTLAMECFQSVNSLIEIGEYIITSEKLGFPSTYGEIFEMLFQAEFVTREELEASKRLVFLRNLIAHEYYEISEEELREMVDKLKVVEGFVKKIREKNK